MSRARRRAVMALVLGLSWVAGPRRARADDDAAAAQAKREYGLATQAYAAKRFVESALAFEASAAYKPNAVTLYTAALSWEQAGHPDRAADAFARALDLPDLLPQQRQNAEERLGALEKTLGAARVTGPEGTRVQLDASSEALVPARLHAPPGAHALAVRWADGAAERRDVALVAGDTLAIALVKTAAPPSAERTATEVVAIMIPSPRVRDERSGRCSSSGTRVIVGASVAGLGLGAVAGAVVLGASAIDAGDASRAAPGSPSLAAHASSLAAWTHVMWVSGAVLLAGGLALALWPSGDAAPRAALVPSLGGATIAGRFQ